MEWAPRYAAAVGCSELDSVRWPRSPDLPGSPAASRSHRLGGMCIAEGSRRSRRAGGATMPKMMRAVQVSKAGGAFELVERELPEPASGQIRIQVEACGICHSDALVKFGAFQGFRSAHSGSRDRRQGRESRRQRDRVAEGRPGRRRLARRPLLRLQCVPQGPLHQLRTRAGHRHQLRRRLRRVSGRPARSRCAHSREAGRCRGRAAALRRHHDLQTRFATAGLARATP